MTEFKIHTPESAPEESREILKTIQDKTGSIANILGVMADSPAALKGYMAISEAVRRGSFSPTEVEVIQMTVSRLNDCGYCLAAHTTLGEKAGVPRDVLDALREERPLKDPKLEALRHFTQHFMKKMGWVEKSDLEAFIKAGYSRAQSLELVLNLSQAFLTNYINHLVQTPLDKEFEKNKVEEKSRDKEKSGRSSHAA